MHRTVTPRLGLDVPEASSVAELLDLLSQLPVADTSQRTVRPAAVPLPSGYEASPLSPERVRARSRTLLAAPVPPEQRQAMLAELASEALAAHRPHSALLIFEMAERRAAKQRAQGKAGGVLARELLRVGLVALAQLRRREAYEALLSRAQGEWGLELAEEPTLLSAAMRAVADAGWTQHALAINATLADAGHVPSVAALNSLLELRLRSADGDGAIDAYLEMRRGHGPPPDGASHALAARAAAARKTSWSGLRNLLRRKWLSVPWGTASANAALCAFAEAGNLRAAAGAAAQMAYDQLPLTAAGAAGALRHASLARRPHDALLAFSLLRRTAAATSANGALDTESYLHYLPFVRPHGRLSFLEQAADDCRHDGRSADYALLLAAVALQLATGGQAAKAAALLTWMHDDGIDLLRLDEGVRRDDGHGGGGGGGGGGGVIAQGLLAQTASRVFAPRSDAAAAAATYDEEEARAAAEAEEAVAAGSDRGGLGGAANKEQSDGGDDGDDDDDGALGDDAVAEAAMGAGGVWLLAVRACADVGSAEVVTAAVEAVAARPGADPAEARLVEACRLELMDACRRAADAGAAARALRRFGSVAPPVAHVRLVQTHCAQPMPDMERAVGCLNAMDEANLLRVASAPCVLQLFTALVRGFGRLGDLDSAHAAFLEGRQWLAQLSPPPEVEVASASSASSASSSASSFASSTASSTRRGGSGSGDDDDDDDVWLQIGPGASDRSEAWRSADRCLCRAMVRAAAPLPRGLLLACTILEELARSGRQLTDGYYASLIMGVGSTHELREQLEALRGGGSGARSFGGGWRVSDATIGSLMTALRAYGDDAADGGDGAATGVDDDGRRGIDRADGVDGGDAASLEERRRGAVKRLGEHGVQLDTKVQEYLALGSASSSSSPSLRAGAAAARNQKRVRTVNANDEIVGAERGGQRPSATPTTRSPRAAAQLARQGASRAATAEATGPLRASDEQTYAEFDELLAQRERPQRANEPLPARDSKRVVEFRRLRNMQT